MDEVARAAGISRQGLYLTFASKEDLFRRAVGHALQCQLTAAQSVLSRSDLALPERLIAACDEWSGKYVGTASADAADLMCASSALAGGTLAQFEKAFEEALAKAISDSALAPRCQAVGVMSAEAAHVLRATAQGLKRTSADRAEFVKAMTNAVRLMCAPLKRNQGT